MTPSLTIRNLKIDLELTSGVRVEDQCLKFEGKVLSDDRTIADYNITNMSTLYMLFDNNHPRYRQGSCI